MAKTNLKIILNRLAPRFHEPGAVLLLLLQQMRPPLPIRCTSGIHFICLVEHDKSLPRGVRVAIPLPISPHDRNTLSSCVLAGVASSHWAAQSMRA